MQEAGGRRREAGCKMQEAGCKRQEARCRMHASRDNRQSATPALHPQRGASVSNQQSAIEFVDDRYEPAVEEFDPFAGEFMDMGDPFMEDSPAPKAVAPQKPMSPVTEPKTPQLPPAPRGSARAQEQRQWERLQKRQWLQPLDARPHGQGDYLAQRRWSDRCAARRRSASRR